MTKSVSKILAGLLSFVMVFCCVCVPAFAMDDTGNPTAAHGDTTMNPKKTVYPVGTKSFYKVEGNTVVYADLDGEGYTAVPSKYITGSQYNDGVDYGMYVTEDGEVHFVDLKGCIDNTNGTYSFYHGTKDSAAVSDKVDTATNQDPTMGTDFYINIENGIDPDGTETEETVESGTNDPRVDYEITVATKTTFQLKATVPMYVCMFGYRGTGNVVTPTADAYQLKNYSTINEADSASIVDIVKVTHMAQLFDKDHSNETIHSIAFKAGADGKTGTYTYWYSKPDAGAYDAFDAYVVLADVPGLKPINASGEYYVIYIDGEWTIKAAGALTGDEMRETVTEIDANHPLKDDFVYNGWNFGTQFEVGKKDSTKEDGSDATKGLALKVTELKAQPATWRLVPTSTAVSAMRPGELAMSIAPVKAQNDASAIDLSTCSDNLDITENGWFLDAPAKENIADKEVTVPTTLGLHTYAQMAGGNVNEAGCTPVVRVDYTLTPAFATDSVDINTVPGAGTNANARG